MYHTTSSQIDCIPARVVSGLQEPVAKESTEKACGFRIAPLCSPAHLLAELEDARRLTGLYAGRLQRGPGALDSICQHATASQATTMLINLCPDVEDYQKERRSRSLV